MKLVKLKMDVYSVLFTLRETQNIEKSILLGYLQPPVNYFTFFFFF